MKALVLSAEWKPRPDYPLSSREITTRRAFNSNQVYTSPRLALATVADPVPGPGEVLVRVRACGVCGSDVHIQEQDADGYVAYADHARLPVVLGHEIAGMVEAVGAGVEALRVGARVCVEPMYWCGACTPCRTGMVNQCSNLEEVGFSVDGGLAEYMIARPQYCWEIDGLARSFPEDQVFEAGALVEPCAVGYNAMFVRAGGFLPGSAVAVFGAGPIGLACLALARAAGAGMVIALETIPERCNLAGSLGADYVWNPLDLARDGQDPAERVLEVTRGEGVAMCVEASGATTSTYPLIERVVGVGGKIAQVGIGLQPTPLTLIRLQQRGVSVYGSIGNSGSGIFPNVIRLLGSGRLNVLPMVTARFPLERAREAIARTSEGRDGKVIVRM